MAAAGDPLRSTRGPTGVEADTGEAGTARELGTLPKGDDGPLVSTLADRPAAPFVGVGLLALDGPRPAPLLSGGGVARSLDS